MIPYRPGQRTGSVPIGTLLPVDQAVTPVARERKVAKNNGDEGGAAAERNHDKVVLFVDKKKIFGSIRSALDELEFGDLWR